MTVQPPIRLLIAEDEENLGMIIEQFMTARGFAVTIVRNGRDALDKLRNERFDVALLDIVMPQIDGLEVLRQLRSQPLPPEVIVVSGNSTVDTALSAIRLGAYDMLAKPYRMAEVEALVRRAWEKRVLLRHNAAMTAQLHRCGLPPEFETQSAAMRAMLSLAEKYADEETPVLIRGEQGAGKESLARQLHSTSKRSGEPFVVVDDAALRDMSNGDDAVDVGGDAIEIAGAGTLYIRDIDRLTPSAQRRLLIGLVSHAVESRDGLHRRVPLQARVIAATSANEELLASAVDEDLLRLVSTVNISLPPLRNRSEDIPLLARRFLLQSGSRFEPDQSAIALLESLDWPGNVAELKLVVQRAALLAGDTPVTAAHVAPAATTFAARDLHSGSDGVEKSMRLSDVEKQHIANVLEYTGWHQGNASHLLGVSPKTLYRKIREYGFERPNNSRRN